MTRRASCKPGMSCILTLNQVDVVARARYETSRPWERANDSCKCLADTILRPTYVRTKVSEMDRSLLALPPILHNIGEKSKLLGVETGDHCMARGDSKSVAEG